MNYYNAHSKLWVSVDCIVFGFDENRLKVLIGRRQMDPGRGEWSLYGGFVGEDESLDDAASRVLYSLTGLRNRYMRQIGAYGNVNRDPGDRVVSVAYYAFISVNDYDNKLLQKHNVEWVDINDMPQMYSDHNTMVDDALQIIRRKISTAPIGFNLLPSLFTLTQLQKLYEAILNTELDKRNFRKRIKEMDFIEKTELKDKLSSKRGAFYYRFNKKAYTEDSNFKL
jgi:ADP-ribose pyrophosphatase YjhB (NUDIX family)